MPADVRTGNAAGGGRRAAGRLGRALLLSLALVVAGALPASAHAVGGASPTNYQTRVLSVTPQVPGVIIRTVEAGARLELSNTSGQDVIVPGYGGEPYLKVGPGGVEENTRSPATYLNQSLDATTTPPAEADVKADPVWRKVSGGTTVAWHDHRTHWMGADPPRPVQQSPGREHVINPEWRLELQRPGQAGGQPIVVTGDLRWVPGPSAAPWLIGAGVLAVVLVLASRTPAWAPLLGSALALLVLIDIVHTVGVWSGTVAPVPVKLYSSVVPVAGWLVAQVAILRLASGQRESGVFFALFAAALALVSVLGDLSGLSSSQLVGSLPGWATRFAIAARLGLAAGIALAGLIAMRRTAMPRRPEASTGPAAAGLLIALGLAGGLLVATAPPAAAHESVVLVKAGAALVAARPGAVRVTAVATYPDGHRAGGLTVRAVATADGRRVAFALRPGGPRGTYAGTVALRPGAWTIRVTASGAAKGKATARVTVPRPAPATSAALDASTDTTETTQPPATSSGSADGSPTTTVLAAEPAGAVGDGGSRAAVTVAVLTTAGIAALVAGGVMMRRARRL